MARYIDADKLSLKLKRYLMPNVDIDGTVTVEVAERYLLELVNNAPTAEVEEVKHGYWKEDGEYQICSVCGEEHYWYEYRATYCEDCGAKMDGGKEE